MLKYPNEDQLHPICKARRLREELEIAVVAEKWKTSHNIALALVKQIDLCIADSTPQLDGLFRIGTMWYQKAPEKARLMIDRFNHKLREEKARLQK